MTRDERIQRARELGIDLAGLTEHQALGKIGKIERSQAMQNLREQGLRVGSRVRVHGSGLLYTVTKIDNKVPGIRVNGKSGTFNPRSIELVEP